MCVSHCCILINVLTLCTFHRCPCNETNLMHYLSSVYSVTMPLHVLGLLVAHHQEVTMYMYAIQVHRQSTKTYNTYQLSYTYIVTS
jgi:hypothetical protein